MSTTRWIIETTCDPGEHADVFDCKHVERVVVDPANLPPERVERAAIRLCHWDGWDYGEPYDQWPVQITDSDGSAWEPIEDAMQDYRDRAMAVVTAFLSDPEPGDQT